MSDKQILYNRIDALKCARLFVKPYDNPMGSHILENKYCYFTYDCKDEQCFYSCVSKENSSQADLSFFEAIGVNDKEWNDEFFNHILRVFSKNTKPDYLYHLFDDSHCIFGSIEKNFYIVNTGKKKTINDEDTDNEFFIDVNTSSEEDLAKLPGVNVIIAKKIISIRQDRGGFSSVEDFIESINIKNHYAKIIKKLIKVSKVEKVELKTNARILDI